MAGIGPYIILLIVFSLALLLRKTVVEDSKKWVDLIICSILIVFSGFRFVVGTDYIGYFNIFYHIGELGRYYDIEWGFYWLVKLFYELNATPQIIFLIYAALTIFFIKEFINEFSVDVEFSWMIFLCIGPYFLSTFNAMRQWLTVAMFAYSLKYVRDEKFFKYALVNALAGLSHYSAFLLIPVYPLIKSQKLSAMKIFICFIGFFIINELGLVKMIADLLYAGAYMEGDAEYKTDATYIVFFVMSIICWAFLKLQKKDKDPGNNILENLNYLSCVTVLLLLTARTISNMLYIRMNMYFFITYMAFVPVLVSKLSKKTVSEGRTVVKVLILMGCIAYYIILAATAPDLVPYRMNFKLFM